MGEKIFKESNYKETLNYMIDRERKILHFKREPMDKYLKEYAYLTDKNERYEHDLNLYQPLKDKDDKKQKFNSGKFNFMSSKEELIKQRTISKLQDIYQEIANQENDKILKAKDSSRRNEINRKRDLRSKSDREKEFHYKEKIRQRYLELLKKANSSVLKDLVIVTHDQFDLNNKQVLTFDASKECRVEQFFSDEQVLNEDAEKLKHKNKQLKQKLNDSQDS